MMNSPYASPPGFVHTSYNLLYDYGKFPVNANCSGPQCPPTELFEKHNEWFCASTMSRRLCQFVFG